MASSLQHCARMLLTRPSSLLAARSCVTKASESASTADVCEQLKMQDIRDDAEVMRPNSMAFSSDGEKVAVELSLAEVTGHSLAEDTCHSLAEELEQLTSRQQTLLKHHASLYRQHIRDYSNDEVMRPNSMEFSPDGESLYSGNKSQVSKKSSINDRPDEEEYSIVESARAKDFSDSLTKSNLVNLQHDLVD